MSLTKSMTGARAKIGFVDPSTGQAQYIGIFNDFSYQVALDVQPAFILGRYTAAELDYTAVEPVQITARGFAVVGQGLHKAGHMPNIQDLLTADYLTMVAVDRGTEAEGGEPRLVVISFARFTGGGGGFQAKALSERTFNYVGIIMDTPDDAPAQSETPGAVDLPG